MAHPHMPATQHNPVDAKRLVANVVVSPLATHRRRNTAVSNLAIFDGGAEASQYATLSVPFS